MSGALATTPETHCAQNGGNDGGGGGAAGTEPAPRPEYGSSVRRSV